MFAPRVAKSQTKAAASAIGKQGSQHSKPVASRQRAGIQFGDAPVRETERTETPLRVAAPGRSWDLSGIPIHPPNRVKPSRTDGQPASLHQVSPHQISLHQVSPARSRRSSSKPGKPASVRSVIAEQGRPLDTTELEFFRMSLGYDFSAVRLHTSDSAAASAAALFARAYTIGRHIVLGRGEYAPNTRAGRHLLVHELGHVIQQSHGGAGASAAENPALEGSAKRAADRAGLGERIAVGGSSGVGIARLSMFDQFSGGKYSWTFLKGALQFGRAVATIVSDLNALTSAERDQAIKDITEERTARGRKHTELVAKQKGQTDPAKKAIFDPVIETISNVLARMDQVLDGVSATIAIGETPASLKASTVEPTAAQKPLIESALKPDLKPGAKFEENIAGDPDSYVAKLANITPVIIDTLHMKLVDNKGPAEHKDPTKVHALSEMERIGNASKRETDNVFGQYKKGPAMKADTKTSRGNIHDLWQETENTLKGAGPGQKRDMARHLIFYFFQSRPQIVEINAAHNADPKFSKDGTPVNDEAKDQKKVADDATATPDAVKALNEIERGWEGAEEGGEVNVQIFKRPDETTGPLAGPGVADRDLMWDMFQTLVHEYIHTLAHPAYINFAESFGNTSNQFNTLVEGADSFLDEVVWSNVEPRVADQKLRDEVEGPTYSKLPPMTVKPASRRRYKSYEQVLKVVNIVGVRNLYAAYFLGDVKKIKRS